MLGAEHAMATVVSMQINAFMTMTYSAALRKRSRSGCLDDLCSGRSLMIKCETKRTRKNGEKAKRVAAAAALG
jgi:hypothetical protein